MEKIKIATGSHAKNKGTNQAAFNQLNQLLFSKNNPLFNKFNQDLFYLDDTHGLISIIKTSYLVKDLTEKQFENFKKFISKSIICDSELSIYFGLRHGKI